MTKRTQNILIYGFLIYIIIGVVMVFIFPDKYALSATDYQAEQGLSFVTSNLLVIGRSFFLALFWPSQLVIFLFT